MSSRSLSPDCSSPHPGADTSFDRRWTRYSVAAIGGLAGTLSGFETTHAALVTTSTFITLTDDPLGVPSATIDLDGDNTPDVGLLVFSAGLVSARGLNGASLAGTVGNGGFFYPTGFQPVQSVGPTLVFSANSAGAPNSFGTLANSSGGAGPGVGAWVGGLDGYLGVQFDLAGSAHYGWVHLVWDPSTDSLTIDQYAYEDQAVSPAAIIPEPSPLVMLALGAIGVARRRRTAAR